MPNLHIGLRSLGKFDHEVKAYTFIVMGDGGCVALTLCSSSPSLAKEGPCELTLAPFHMAHLVVIRVNNTKTNLKPVW